MAQKSARAASIDKLIGSTVREIRSALKTRGITVPEVDGPSDDDLQLRGLQELQAIAAALKTDDEAKSGYTVGTDFAPSGTSDKTAKGK